MPLVQGVADGLGQRRLPRQFGRALLLGSRWRTLALSSIRSAFLWLRHVFADGGYAGEKLQKCLVPLGKWTIETVKRSDVAKGFVLLPRRWVVERTFAWLNRNRRLAKGFEKSMATAVTWMMIATRRLTRA